MEVRLTVTAGPHKGRRFAFDRRDTFLVGRSPDAHFRLAHDDPYFSRRHFLVEVRPPRVRVYDLNSRNGTFVNGQRVPHAELRDGDELTAGHTVLAVAIQADPSSSPDHTRTAPPGGPAATWSTAGAGPPRPPAIPGYRLGEVLGRGGMGVVYRAVREADGGPAAVKAIAVGAGVGPRQVSRFVREAKLLGRLDHPHVVRLLDAGDAGGQLYIVMELVAGTDAGRLVREGGPLPVADAVWLARQALDGLAHAHARGIAHRDVKPGNLLVGGGADGRPLAKVADFGLARAFEESQLTGLTMPGEVAGTPAFMPPEQVTHYREAGPAADQYATAATLYYLLTGAYTRHLPDDLGERLLAVLNDPPVPIRDRRPDLPAKLADVIHRALQREAADRYPSVAEFRDRLAAFG